MQTKPALLMPDARHPADPAVTLPKKQRKSICILDEAVVGTVSDGQHAGRTSSGICGWPGKWLHDRPLRDVMQGTLKLCWSMEQVVARQSQSLVVAARVLLFLLSAASC